MKVIWSGPLLGGKLILSYAPELGENVLVWTLEHPDTYFDGKAELDMTKPPETWPDIVVSELTEFYLGAMLEEKTRVAAHGYKLH